MIGDGTAWARDDAFREGMEVAIELIDAHIPSLTDFDEEEIGDIVGAGGGVVATADIGDLAIRTCHCGQHIDGFYEFVDHLKDVLRKEMS